MIPEEGQTVERKESLSLWRDIVETCAAFATAQGGKVFVGVADDGRITGVQIGKGTLEDLANRIAQNTTPKVVPAITTQDEPSPLQHSAARIAGQDAPIRCYPPARLPNYISRREG